MRFNQISFELYKEFMPYELVFTRVVLIADHEQYFNDCCVGGDVVMDQLLPALRAKYDDIETNQEDWGWFAWFKKGSTKLAVDVFSDDAEKGEFRIHITSKIPRFLLGARTIDTPELEHLRDLVVETISQWVGKTPQISHLDAKLIS
jgi:hypothetical protein